MRKSEVVMSEPFKPQPLPLKRHPDTDETLISGAKLAEKFRLHRWDYIIAGDGSATTWDNTAGFGSILYDRQKQTRQKFFGGFSCGTNNVAEIMAVLHPLMFLDATVKTKHKAPTVYIISDSEYVVNAGNNQTERKSNKALWAAIDNIGTRFVLLFRHCNRMILPANVYGDTVGNMVRITMEGMPR
jgi:ribonuclease HI